MDLFSAAGIEVSPPGRARSGRVAPRTLRIPLLNYKVVEEDRRRAVFAPTPEQSSAARNYARKARSPKFVNQKETAVRPIFVADILEKVLGYKTVDPDGPHTLAFERPIRRGAVDVALGHFPGPDGQDDIVAPFELKGPATADLDAIVPGARRSPVQQAWDYAIDAPGSRWVLVSNCIEIRLYGFGRGREAYEVFDLTRLDDEEEHARLWLLLSAARLLTGATDALLQETDSASKEVTDKLYVEYKGLRDRLIAYLVDSAEGPRLSRLAAIELAQKLLDRILFIAFAQRTDLLPDKLLERAAKARNEFDPQPLWNNFKALFRSVNRGAVSLSIWAYNGGLFADDPVADALVLPDPLAGEVAALGEWDYRREVPVTVLGHIFEQSITDIERLKAESRGEPPPSVTKRKREGVVYTPDIVTRFLVERTVGLSLRERFDTLWRSRRLNEGIDAARERDFWRDYLAALRAFTVVDPACGSGAFLVAAFDALAAEYRRTSSRLADLGAVVDFDYFDEIVTKNLHGVDLNAESVEITRLSLWLKTARRDHRLQNLEATIKVGDSLIEDAAFTARPFDWHAAFPQVFARGGFDVVVGNPPYVRMELIKAVKPYLEKHYVVAADRADLYAYFFERGVGLLKEGGRLGYISSSTFFRTGSGENLRTFLGDRVAIESVIDFGDLQLFEGVTTYPAILTLRRGSDAKVGKLLFLRVDEALPKDLGRAFELSAQPMPRARLGAGSWRFEDEPLARLRDKITKGRKTLGEVYGAPLRGIVTGLNEAFVIEAATRDRLVAADPKSADLLKPFLRGEDIKRWRVESDDLFLVNTPKGTVDIENYAAVRDWLLSFRPELEHRATKQEWWELQQAQMAYQPAMQLDKIVYPEFSQGPKFCFDTAGYYLSNKCFFVCAPIELLAVLNSKLQWYWLFGEASPLRGGQWRLELREQYVSQLPIPELPNAARVRLAALGETCTAAARQRFAAQSVVRHRILDLAPPGRRKLTGKLENWHDLDFAAFRAEVKKAFRCDIPVKERGDWEAFLLPRAVEVHRLTKEIAAAERMIDAVVYDLFNLGPDEIALLEASLSGQY